MTIQQDHGGSEAMSPKAQFEATDASSLKVDPSRPLLRDIISMPKKQYLVFIHTPQFPPTSARLFANDYLEMFTRTHWWVIPLVWLPVATTLMYFGYSSGVVLPRFAVLLAIGVAAWTLIEYSLHRWLFHVDDLIPDHPVFITVHFLMHGIHHLLPQDPLRLVFPPLGLLPLIALVWSVWRLITYPLFIALPEHGIIIAGAMVGYVCYDMFHYYSHHGSPKRTSYFGRMKAYHMKHHYMNYHLGYGITSKLWDYAFGTVLRWGREQ